MHLGRFRSNLFLRGADMIRLSLVMVLAAFAAGCGGGGKDPATADGRVKPKGRVVKGGNPVDINTAGLPPGDPGLQVIFIKPDGVEIPARVTDAKAGAFELVGGDGKGIAPGKYKVAVLVAPSGGTDQLKGKFDRKNTKIEKDVNGTDEVVIDLDKPTG